MRCLLLGTKIKALLSKFLSISNQSLLFRKREVSVLSTTNSFAPCYSPYPSEGSPFLSGGTPSLFPLKGKKGKGGKEREGFVRKGSEVTKVRNK